jgi:chromosome segregation ATPase
MATKANTTVVEIKKMLCDCAPRMIYDEKATVQHSSYPNFKMSLHLLNRRLYRVEHELEKIHAERDEYEKGLNHLSRARDHCKKALNYLERDINLSIDELSCLESETEKLVNYLDRKVRERIKPIIDSYKLLE